MKRNDLIKSMAGVFVLMLLVVRGEAQLVSCNGFLQGNYIEVGVNSLGAYGSSVAAPAGYHPRGGAGVFNTCTSTTPAFGTGLGFVADPDKDGWNVGTPNYIGDYFLPGTPYEGWEIAVNGSQANENNGASSSLGSITSVTNSGQVRSVVWDGSYSGLSIHQVTSFDIGNLYFTTNVTLTNTTGATISNIYYQRGVDPDNEEPLTGNYTTNNNIDYQLPNALGATLVSGTGLTYGAYLGLGTLDARAKAFIISSWPPTVALSSVYAGVSPFQYSGTTTADYGIGLVFNVGSLAPGASTTLTYVYILKGSDFPGCVGSDVGQLDGKRRYGIRSPFRRYGKSLPVFDNYCNCQ